MAGDWIKMRTDIADDPAVVAIACSLGMDEDTVVGKLHRLWSWADRHTTDGNAVGVTYCWIDRYLNAPGFAECMEEVGWLGYDGAVISIPNFANHNGQSAKTRALTAKRVANARVTPRALPREEKRREEKEELSLPEILNTDQFKKALADWKSYHKPYKPVAWNRMIARAASLAEAHGLPAVCAAMDRAMANGWTGWDQESSFQSRGSPVVGHKPEYRQVELRVFNAHARQHDFLVGPKRDGTRVYGQLKSKAKIESNTQPGWKPA